MHKPATWLSLAGKFGLIALLAVVGVTTLQQPSVSTAAAGQVIIVSETVSGGAASREATAVTASGKTPVLMTAAAFTAMTTSAIATYDAVVFGDATCRGPGVPADITTLAAAGATWGPAITGNVFINGTDPVYHDGQGGASMTNGGVAFAAADAGHTGLYISLSCYYHETAAHTAVPLLDGLVPGGFTVTGVGCFNDAHIVASHPALTGMTDATISNWSCSVHEAFDKWPTATFEVLAIARNIGSSYTAPDGSVGTPYVLARGRTLSILSDIKLTPATAQNLFGQQHTLTATVTTNTPTAGTPVVGTTVHFAVISGPNSGKTGNAATNASGIATWSYTGSVAGTDIIEATFVDAAGKTQRSNRVTKTWCDPAKGGLEYCTAS